MACLTVSLFILRILSSLTAWLLLFILILFIGINKGIVDSRM